MSLTTLVLLVVLLVAVWIMIRIRRSAAEDEAVPRSAADTAATAYHAVSIKFSGTACQAAKDMTGRRFLSSAAPKLPLPDCNALECKCRFVHHKDRRSGKERRSPFSPAGFGGGTGNYESEKREGNDRRKSRGDFDL